MELIQLGAQWCRPCIAAKDYITNKYDLESFTYTFIDLDNLENLETKYVTLIDKVQPKSIPSFICAEGDQVILEFRGFDREMIDKCISYMINEKLDVIGIKVEDTIPAELFFRIQEMSNEIENKHKKFLDDLTNEGDGGDYDE